MLLCVLVRDARVVSVTIRSAHPGEVDQAVAVWRRANTARRAGAAVPAEAEHRVRSYTQKADAFLLVADETGELVGMALGMQALADDGADPLIPLITTVPATADPAAVAAYIDRQHERAKSGQRYSFAIVAAPVSATGSPPPPAAGEWLNRHCGCSRTGGWPCPVCTGWSCTSNPGTRAPGAPRNAPATPARACCAAGNRSAARPDKMENVPTPTFEELLAEGAAVDVSTWGAAFLPGRYLEERPPWEYTDIVAPYLTGAHTMLDMGTGDGSKLLTLRPLPPRTVAYEEWAPTIPAALRTLRAAGVPVVQCLASVDNTDPTQASRPPLPFADGAFDVVVNRHECFAPDDVYRILRPGGVFVTQQVGGGEANQLGAIMGVAAPTMARWDLAEAQRQVEGAGLAVLGSGEASLEMRCTDVGALVAYLRAVPWYLPDFTVTRYRERLHALHEQGEARWHTNRFWLAAQRRPAG